MRKIYLSLLMLIPFLVLTGCQYTVSGTITDEDGHPLKGVEIQVLDGDAPLDLTPPFTRTSDANTTTYSDENGSYSATFETYSDSVDLEYKVRTFSEFRFVTSTILLNSSDIQENIEVQDTEETTHSYLRGRVINEEGQPLANAELTFNTFILTDGKTDSDGNYEIPLYQNERTLKVGKDGYQVLSMDINYTDDIDHILNFTLQSN